MNQDTPNIDIGQLAPDFALTSIQGTVISPKDYQGKKRVILWFSRGFNCPFCRQYMNVIEEGYEALHQEDIEVVQVAPNLLDSARIFFRDEMPAFPFVCDPDKRLFARYGLGDRGVLEATRSTAVSLAHAARVGELGKTMRAGYLDTANRNFMRRLHHHALTAVEQGIFLIDQDTIIRYQTIVSPIEPIPNSNQLLFLAQSLS